MGSTTKQLCRLCLQTGDDVVNIWDTFLDSTIASVLAKHFWFQIHRNDGLTEYICEHCWMQTKTFHKFYRQVEQFQKCIWDSVEIDKGAQESTISHDSKVVALDLEPDLSIVKCEEVEIEVKPDTAHLILSSSEYREDSVSDESEMEQAADDENQCSSSAQNNEDDDHVLRSNVKKSGRLSSSEKLELEGQIRDHVTMNCDICSDVKFKNLLEARLHYRIVHGKDGYITCCGKKFHKRADVVQHIRHHVNLTANGHSEELAQEAQIREMFAMKCEICCDVVEFVTLLEARRHYRKVHGKDGYITCCGKKFHKRADVVQHIRHHVNLTAHGPSEQMQQETQIREMFGMKCEICSDVVEFVTLLEARRHYRKVHGKDGYITCCGKKFHKRADVVQHIRHHVNLTAHGPSEQMQQEAQIREMFGMQCEICSDVVEFVTLLEVRQHYRKVHKTRGYLTCCNRKFYRRHKMVEHIRRHTNSDTFSCECGKRFPSKRALKTHMESHAPPDSRRFQCSLCPRNFVRKSDLTVHVQYKHGPSEGEKNTCEACGKNFRSSLQLSAHIRFVHELTAKYVCEVCARKFKSKSALQYHIDHSHSTTPPAKVQCELCGAWLTAGSLRGHRQLHMEAKPINCSICNKMVSNKHQMSNHIRRFHCEKRYQCQLCEKAFKYAKNLKEHLAVHTGQDLYDCPYCEKKFKSNANMYSHRKKAHLTEWTRDNKNKIANESGQDK